MFCQQIEFAHESCLIEVSAEGREDGPAVYVARMSVVEEHGSVVRPLIFAGGRRVKVRATTAAAAMQSAIEYLEGRFGAVHPPEHACALGGATIGVPFAVMD